jgi:acetyl-CoA synthetase
MDPVVWTPPAEYLEHSATARFMAAHGITDWDALHTRSVAEPEWFWDAVVEFFDIPFSKPYTVVRDPSGGPAWNRWFADGEVNLSTVCVGRWVERHGDRVAIRHESEDGTTTSLTFGELADRVARMAAGLRARGVEPGEKVAVFLPMGVEAVIAMLAIAHAGLVFVPVFSGFAAEAVAARVSASGARLLLTAESVLRRGRRVPMAATAHAALDLVDQPTDLVVVGDAAWGTIVDTAPMEPHPTGAEDVVLITYTSGTTGKPKGVVHVHGGMAVKVREGAFQFDIGPADTLMWMTDMGWVMGQWVVICGLGNGATIATYDGAPDTPDPGRLWGLVERLGITVLGVSPTLIRSLKAAGDDWPARHDLSSLRAFGSTGEPWNPDPWHWLFGTVGGGRIPIVNISGGTEIGACILSVNLMRGIKPCALGDPALGMDSDVFDDEGRPLRGAVGELVIKTPWPGMTRGFHEEPERYEETYWSRFPGVWAHGDWASIDDDGYWYLHGRSDETLNIAGKRLGPAEVESVVASHPAVVAAAAVAVPDPVKGDVIALYVVAPDAPADLAGVLSDLVADAIGKPFRPAHVVVVDDLPRTRSAKVMRRVIRALASGRPPGDLTSLENPESLEGIGVLGDE